MTDEVSPSYAPAMESSLDVDARDRSDSGDDPYSPEIARPIERFLFLSFSSFLPLPVPAVSRSPRIIELSSLAVKFN